MEKEAVVRRLGELIVVVVVAVVGWMAGDNLISKLAGLVLPASVAALIEAREIRRSRQRARATTLDTVLPHGFRSLPAIREVDPRRLGVFPSTTAQPFIHRGETWPPYVPREIDRDLDVQLTSSVKSGRMVVVVGPSKAGKTRTAYEAIYRQFRDHRIIVPVSPRDQGAKPSPLGELASIDPPLDLNPFEPVLWLDDVESYAADLLAGNVARLRSRYPGMVTIATVQLDRWAEIRDHRNMEPFVEIELAAELDGTERKHANAIYPDLAKEPDFGRLGEYFVAADKLREKYRKGLAESPTGRAVVEAAIDWRRAGMLGPVPESELRELAGLYLARHHAGMDLTDETFAQAIEWARNTVASSAALLQLEGPSNRRAFRAFDYLVDWVAHTGPPVPTATWTFVLSHASEDDHVAIGLAARSAGRREEAEREWSAIAGSGGPAAAWASLYLGRLRAELRNTEAARTALERALESGVPRAAAEAAFELGLLLKADGDLVGAQKAWRQAVASGYAHVVPSGALHLGLLLSEIGDMTGAEELWWRGAAYGEHPSAQRAALRLAELLIAQGRPKDAVESLELVVGLDRTGEALALKAEALLHLRRWTDAWEEAELALKRAEPVFDARPAGSSSMEVTSRITGRALQAATLALLKLRRPSEAMKSAEKAVDVEPDSASAWAMLSRCALEMGDATKVGAAATRLAQNHPGSAVARRALAHVAMAENDLSALDHADAALRLDPGDPASHVLLGRVHLRAGRDREALVAFADALALDPGQMKSYDEELPFELVIRIWADGRRRSLARNARELLSMLPGLPVIVPFLAGLLVLAVFESLWTWAFRSLSRRLSSGDDGRTTPMRKSTNTSRFSSEEIAAQTSQRYASFFGAWWTIDRPTADLPATAVALLDHVGLMRRATSTWRLTAGALLAALGGLVAWEGVNGEPGSYSVDAFALAMAWSFVAIAVWMIRRWNQTRRDWREFPAELRTRLLEADYAARPMSYVLVALLPVGALAVFAGLGATADGSVSVFWYFVATILAATAANGVAKVWRASRAAKSPARSSEETLVRRARSDILPATALSLIVGGVASTVNAISIGDHWLVVPGGILASTGALVLGRWVRARRSIFSLPGGHLMLRRDIGRGRSRPRGLSAAPNVVWSVALGILLVFYGALGIVEFIEDGGRPPPHEPGPLVGGVGLIGVGTWQLVRSVLALRWKARAEPRGVGASSATARFIRR